ncbi:type II toxin-antitoxin system CcdA family antitoxin [Sphingomonadaceae bacterium LXI357]|uniref:Type II toxin-antitoxin system CcdA family antitoxin n=1 Tax=Stakelama marina TaxID=2826939 RepID=A0A8T4IER2_9SPHN|nr:type II toxin-antitoxin system CcdA family antitoxin [Stakelama marina]
MKHDSIGSGKRKPVNPSIDSGVVAAAREARLNLSQVCEAALRSEAKRERERQWREENREAIESWNRWIDECGLPLENIACSDGEIRCPPGRRRRHACGRYAVRPNRPFRHPVRDSARPAG